MPMRLAECGVFGCASVVPGDTVAGVRPRSGDYADNSLVFDISDYPKVSWEEGNATLPLRAVTVTDARQWGTILSRPARSAGSRREKRCRT